MSDIVFGIKVKLDGKDIDAGLSISREHLRQFAIDAKRAGDAAAGGMTSAAQGIRSVSGQLGEAKQALIGYLSVTQAMSSAKWILDQASAMQQLDARLKVATSSAGDYARAQTGVFEIANRWGAAVDQTAGAFARLNPVIGQMGGGAAITLKMLDGLAASLRLSGATAAETSAVLLQFSQAMGSGRVGGDEFRSMMENAEPLMRAVAGQLNKTTAELRQMAEEGKLTSSVFGNALLPAIDKLTKQAAGIPMGISQAWQVMWNNLQRDFGAEFGAQAGKAAAGIATLSEQTGGFARAVHAGADALVGLTQAAAVVGAGAGGVWLTKQAEGARLATVAWLENRAATQAAAAAALAGAEADVVKARTTLALIEADHARALAERAAASATIYGTAAIGAQSAALQANLDAKIAFRAATLLLLETERAGAVAQAELAAAQTALTAATARGTAGAGLAGAAMTALGGPIGIVTGLLLAGGMAWGIWGSRAEDAGEKARKTIDDALARADRRQKEQKFGTGEAGQDREALSAIQQQLAAARWTAERAIYEHIRDDARAEVRRLEEQEARVKASMAQADKAAAPAGDPRLSAAGEYGKLAEPYKWRNKLVEKYDTELLNIQQAFADKMSAAAEKDKAKILAGHQSLLRAVMHERQEALEGLPDAKEGRALSDANADALVAKAKADAKRIAEALKQEHEQFRMSTVEYLHLMQATQADALNAEIAALEGKRRSATKGSEKFAISARIDELKAELAALPKQTQDALEDAEAKAAAVFAKMSAAAGKVLAPLAAAGLKFGADFGETLQEAAANGREATLEMGRQVWANIADQTRFDEAKKQFDALFEEMKVQLERVQQVASADGGLLAGIAAAQESEDIKARLLPALRQLQQQMETLKGDNPERMKIAAQAVGEVNKAASGIPPVFQKIWDDAGRGLQDSLFRAFENGKLDVRKFGEYAKSYFATLGLRTGVQIVGEMAMGGVRSMFGMPGSGGGGIGGGIPVPGFGGTSMLGGAIEGFGSLVGSGAIGEFGAGMAGTFVGPVMEGSAAALGASLGAALPYIGLAIAAFSLLSGGGGGPKTETFGGDRQTFPGYYQQQEGLDKIAAGVKRDYTEILGLFDRSAGSALVGISGDSDPQGTAPDSASYEVTVDGVRRYSAANYDRGTWQQHAPELAARALLAALEATDINSVVNAYLDGLDIKNLSAEQAAAAATVVRGIDQMVDAFGRLGVGAEAVTPAMIGAMGGMQAAVAAVQAYDAAMWSEEEKRARLDSEVRKQFADIGKAMPGNREEFRALVTEFAQMGDAGAKTLATLMRLAPAFAQVTDAADAARVAAKQQAESVRRTWENDASSLRRELAGALAGDLQTTQATARETLSTQETLAERLKDLTKALGGFASGLRSGALSPLSPEEKYRETKAAFEAIDRRARLGDPEAMGGLQQAAETFLSASRDYFASAPAYAADFAAVEAAVSASLAVGGRQLSIAESAAAAARAQISALQQQIDLLASIDRGISGLGGALLPAARASGGNPAAVQGVAQLGADYAAAFAVTSPGQVVDWSAWSPGASFTRLEGDRFRVSFPGQSPYEIGADMTPAEVARLHPEIAAGWEKEYGIKIPGFAAGGLPDGLAWVGERGPELVDFQGRERVYSNDALRAALSGGGGIDLGPVVAELQAGRRIQEALLRQTAEMSRRLDALDSRLGLRAA